MTTTVRIIAMLTARSGKTEAVRNLLDGMIGASRSEPGNLRHDLWVDSSEPGRFVLDELYTNASAAAAHRASPHFQNYLANINGLAERVAPTLDPLAVA